MDRTSDLKSTLPGIEPAPAKSGAVKRKTPSGAKPASASAGGLGSLRIWQKLALIVALTLVPVAVLIFLLVNKQQEDVAFAQQELRGSEYLSVLADALTSVQEHFTLFDEQLQGDTTAASKRAAMAAEVEKQILALEALDQQYGTLIPIADNLQLLKKDWAELKVALPKLNVDQALEKHVALAEETLFPMIDQVGISSKITLDPEQASYYVGDLLVTKLPDLTQQLEELQHVGVDVAKARAITNAKKLELQGLRTEAFVFLDETSQAVLHAGEASPELQGTIGTTAKTLETSLNGLFTTLDEQFLQGSQVNVNPDTYFTLSEKPITAVTKLFDQSEAAFKQLLDRRIAQLRGQQLTSLLAVFVVLALVVALTVYFVRSITGPVAQLSNAANRLSAGDLEAQVQVQSSDELGQLATTFNETIRQLKLKAQADQEQLESSRQLQNNIGDFLNVTMDIAQGDLTKRGKVSEDVLGNVVDAINLMTEEIGYVLKDVQGVTNSVTGSANLMTASTDAVLQGAQAQATEAAQAQADTQAMTNAIRKMAQRALDSSSAAQQTLQSAQSGQEAVNNTLSGMQSIRREVSSISKGIKGLSDRSLEISEIVETISGIAAQTNLLALNAAIEASGAGEAGSRFAIVADEVRKLADDSAKATNRVGSLIKSVQTEIQELVSSVEGGTKEVEQGYRIAQQAGERLREIADLANQSSALAQAISSAAQQQVQGVERVAAAVQSIASTAQRTQEESSKGRQSAEQLRSLASQLSGTLERFRLPA